MRDPTASVRLRQHFRMEALRRLTQLTKVSRAALVEEDMLGMGPISGIGYAHSVKVMANEHKLKAFTDSRLRCIRLWSAAIATGYECTSKARMPMAYGRVRNWLATWLAAGDRQHVRGIGAVRSQGHRR